MNISDGNGTFNAEGIHSHVKGRRGYRGIMTGIFASVMIFVSFIKLKDSGEDFLNAIEHESSNMHRGLTNRQNRPKERTFSKIYEHSKNLNAPFNTNKDIPFFFMIPKSGTSTIRNIITRCLDLRMAVANDFKFDHSNNKLRVIDLGPRRGRYVNIDFSLQGMETAKRFNLASSGLVDVAIETHLHQGSGVFTETNPLRFFTVFRHPILRSISAYHYSKIGTWEKTYNAEYKQLSLMEYVNNPKYFVDNWATRMLSNVHNQPLEEEDFIYAKHLLKDKILILLLDDFDESIDRLMTYMHWSVPKGIPGGKNCVKNLLHSEPHANEQHYKGVNGGSPEWQMLQNVNKYDMELYYYAKQLYHGEQKQMMEKIRSERQS